MATRLKPDLRRAEILEAALETARRVGLHALTREDVAKAAGVSPGLVSVRLGLMTGLRQSVQALARRRGVKLGQIGPHEADRDERVYLSGPLSADAQYRLLVTGPVAIDEIDHLIQRLQAERATLLRGRR